MKKNIKELSQLEQTLFKKRFRKHITNNQDDLKQAMLSTVDELQDTLKAMYLKYDDRVSRIVSDYTIENNDLDIEVTLALPNDELVDLNLQYNTDRKEFADLMYNGGAIIKEFESDIFDGNAFTNFEDILETYLLLKKLDHKTQDLFADIFVEYVDSPITLLQKMVLHLGDTK